MFDLEIIKDNWAANSAENLIHCDCSSISNLTLFASVGSHKVLSLKLERLAILLRGSETDKSIGQIILLLSSFWLLCSTYLWPNRQSWSSMYLSSLFSDVELRSGSFDASESFLDRRSVNFLKKSHSLGKYFFPLADDLICFISFELNFTSRLTSRSVLCLQHC